MSRVPSPRTQKKKKKTQPTNIVSKARLPNVGFCVRTKRVEVRRRPYEIIIL